MLTRLKIWTVRLVYDCTQCNIGHTLTLWDALVSYDHVLVYSSSLLHMVLKHLVWWTRLWSGSGHQLPSCLGSCSFFSGSRTSYGKKVARLLRTYSFFQSETMTHILYFCSMQILWNYHFWNLDFQFIMSFKSKTKLKTVLVSLHIPTWNDIHSYSKLEKFNVYVVSSVV